MCRSNIFLCQCCGEETNRYYDCSSRCKSKTECVLCSHCIEHHHKNCTEQLRQKADEIRLKAMMDIAELREKHNINIFEYGENKLFKRFRGI